MSTLETILSRAMRDTAFAEQLITNPEEALADYDLSAEELAQFEGISSVEFAALEADVRKSFSFYISAAPRANNEDK